MTETDLEHLAITWFQDAGWDHRAGPDIAPDSDTPERGDYRQVLLQGELREALARLNPNTPANVLDEVAHQIAKPEHPSLIQSNRAIHEALVGGVPVEVEIAFFQAIRAVIAKATTSDARLTEENRNAVLKQILDNAVVAEGVEDIFRLAGLERPDIGILSDAFLDEVRQLPQKNFAVELLQKLLQKLLRAAAQPGADHVEALQVPS